MKERESKRAVEEREETNHTIVKREKTIDDKRIQSKNSRYDDYNKIKTNKKQQKNNYSFQETLEISNSSNERNDDTTVVVTPNIFFMEKAARSIAEIQQRITTVADVMIFLEILGYDDKLANEMGYHDLVGLAK